MTGFTINTPRPKQNAWQFSDAIPTNKIHVLLKKLYFYSNFTLFVPHTLINNMQVLAHIKFCTE